MIHLYCRFFYKSFFFPRKTWITLKHLFATTFGFSDLQNISYWRLTIEREKPLFGQLCAKMNPAVICDGIYGFAGRGGIKPFQWNMKGLLTAHWIFSHLFSVILESKWGRGEKSKPIIWDFLFRQPGPDRIKIFRGKFTPRSNLSFLIGQNW